MPVFSCGAVTTIAILLPISELGVPFWPIGFGFTAVSVLVLTLALLGERRHDSSNQSDLDLS